MSSVTDIISGLDVEVKDRTVTISLISTDACAARVFFEDINARITSGNGLVPQLKGAPKPAGATEDAG
jgi:hypothetical protein